MENSLFLTKNIDFSTTMFGKKNLIYFAKFCNQAICKTNFASLHFLRKFFLE